MGFIGGKGYNPSIWQRFGLENGRYAHNIHSFMVIYGERTL